MRYFHRRQDIENLWLQMTFGRVNIPNEALRELFAHAMNGVEIVEREKRAKKQVRKAKRKLRESSTGAS